jgi:hypothetical protein
MTSIQGYTRGQFDQGLPPNPSLIMWLLAVYYERVFATETQSSQRFFCTLPAASSAPAR